ncbi:MAG TPA: hypothetical protein PLN91_00715 [Rhodanobacteraceae bacterium]|nr:hypothetical protein [Rhodanobacteraceae bacterium]
MSNVTQHPAATARPRTYIAAGDDGMPNIGKTLPARNEEFLKAYPPSEGWCLIVEHQLSQLKLVDVNGEPYPTVLFTAMLRHGSDLRATASTLVPITGNKAWEAGESNARSRLFEALGFGRFEMEQDEARSLTQVATLPGPFQSNGQGLSSQPTEPAMASQSAAPEPPPSTPSKDVVPKAFRAQITRKCQLLGMDVPTFASLEEAKEFWSRINKTVAQLTSVPEKPA